MNFAQAIEKMKESQCVSRTEWGKFQWIQTDGLTIWYHNHGLYLQWQPYHSDLLADDWEVRGSADVEE